MGQSAFPRPGTGRQLIDAYFLDNRSRLLEIAAFLDRNPLGGQHHLAFEVPDIAEARAAFEAMGKRVLGPTRIGAHGTPVFFVHPKDMAGVLTEIMEPPGHLLSRSS